MKQLLFITLLFISQDNLTKHVGEWIGDDAGDPFSVILDKEGFATIKFGTESYGGQKSDRNGTEVEMTYKVNYDSKPVEIDIIITDIATKKEQDRLLGIIEFTASNRMRLELGFETPGERPKTFSDQSFDLMKVK